jgi:glucokinase
MSAPAANIAIGIDVGGTAIKGGLVETDGCILERRSIPTNPVEGVDHVLGRIAAMVGDLANHAASLGRAISGVGVGVPGTIRHATGIVEAPPNLPGWKNVPVVARLCWLTAQRVVLENDANAAALGEFLCGAGRGTKDMVMLTLGTGVGGGIIANGNLFRGELENAGELGHMIVAPGGRLCGCGQRGCLEAYSSATQTAARVIERIKRGEPSSLTPLVESGQEISAEQIVAAADEGDALAADAWRETCLHLAVGCINIQHMLNPQRIVLAGGMSAAGAKLLNLVEQLISENCSRMLGPLPVVGLAELGNDAGLVGAALVAMKTV